MKKIEQALHRFLNSRAMLLAVTVISCLTVTFSLEHYAIPLFVLLMLFTIVMERNFLNIFLPMVLLNGFALRTGAQTTYLMSHVWLVVPVIIGILLHFLIHLRRPIVRGKLFFSHIATSIALLLGGIGSITAAEYFNPASSLYYILLLGPGMLFFYFWFRNHVASNEFYDCRERLMESLYLLGVFCVYTILEQAARGYAAFGTLQGVFWSNDICELLIFAIPAAFYFARRDYRHLFVGLLFCLAMFPTLSYSGMLVGCLLTALCLVWLAVYRPDKRRLTVGILILLSAAAVGILLLLLLMGRFPYDSVAAAFLAQENGRLTLIRRAFESFLSNPVFGVGLGAQDGTATAFMSMRWTHNYVMQIVGSMGIVGILAYGYHLYLRGKVLLRRRDPFLSATALSYLGILLLSMLQPGEFCPMPYETMAVMLFAVAEVSEEERAVGKGGISA